MSIALCLLFTGALSTRFTSLSFITLDKRWARLHRHMPAAVGGTPLGTGLFGYFHQGGIIGKVQGDMLRPGSSVSYHWVTSFRRALAARNDKHLCHPFEVLRG